MSRFLVLLCVVFIVWWLRRWWLTKGKHQSSSELISLALWGIAGITLFLFVIGKGNVVIALGAALLAVMKGLFPWLQRAFPLLVWWRKAKAQQRHLQSHVIDLKINPLTGELSGKVLSGEFKGESLSDLEQLQLQTLLDDLLLEDPKGVQLLAAYLEFRFGAQWQGMFQLNHYTANASSSSHSMTEQEACEILGVTTQASAKEVNKAYKSLMQKVHPDRGGSEYLARLAGEAKETLLKNNQ